jgi:hypothetical protein
VAQFSDDHDDEDAFHWAGDETSGREGARLPTKGRDAVAEPAGAGAPAVPGLRSRPGSALALALFALLYLALTVGWIIAIGYTGAGAVPLLSEILWQFGEFTALIAAPLWFGGTVLLTRGSRLLVRAGWLLLGLGVLLPWPLFPALVVGS